MSNWKLVRNHDKIHVTHVLTNGRTQISIWDGELTDPDLEDLSAQLERGATVSDEGRPWLKVLRDKHKKLLEKFYG